MKMKLALFSLIVLVAPATKVFADPDPNFHIYLAFGQSNMEGGGQINEEERTVDPRFQVMADFDVPDRGWKKGEWYGAVPPLTRRSRGISLVDSFGRHMVANLPQEIRVGVIKVGVSGTRIELWDESVFRQYLYVADAWKSQIAAEYNNDPYAYLYELAKKAQEDGVIKGILLHQGESNSQDLDWPKKVKTIYDNLIGDLNLDPREVPLLAGEVVGEDNQGEEAKANKIIKRLPQVLPNSYVISSAGLPVQRDHLHFTADGYREFGKRYAKKMLETMGIEIEEEGEAER